MHVVCGVDATWLILCNQVRTLANNLAGELGLGSEGAPAAYAALHIRRGDKVRSSFHLLTLL